jgi:hypothetical protein
MEGLSLTGVELEPHPYQILTSMGGSKKVQGSTKHEVVIQVNPTKPIDYTIMWAHAIVTHATSYDVLVGGAILYPLLGNYPLLTKIANKR